jgi:hypothetical protein
MGKTSYSDFDKKKPARQSFLLKRKKAKRKEWPSLFF